MSWAVFRTQTNYTGVLKLLSSVRTTSNDLFLTCQGLRYYITLDPCTAVPFTLRCCFKWGHVQFGIYSQLPVRSNNGNLSQWFDGGLCLK